MSDTWLSIRCLHRLAYQGKKNRLGFPNNQSDVVMKIASEGNRVGEFVFQPKT